MSIHQATIFNRNPDEIVGSDYFYRTNFDETINKILSSLNPANNKLPYSSLQEYHELKDSDIKRNFLDGWNQRFYGTAQTSPYAPWLDEPRFREISAQIAGDGELFLDIASDFSMGMAPYILRLNSDVPCYVSDIDERTMRTLRECLQKYLPEYKISVVSFDNNDMPIHDNSLKYVTSIDGVTSSTQKSDEYTVMSYCLGSEKVISEIYRILKHGGYFITCEQSFDCDYDLRKIYENYSVYGKLFGIYNCDEVQSVIEDILKYSWKDAFEAAGFEIELEKKYHHRYSESELKQFMFRYTYYNNLRKWTDTEIALNYLTTELTDEICRAKSANEILSCKAFTNAWTMIGANVADRKNLEKTDVVNLLWEYVKSGSASGNFKHENTGFDIYHVNALYALKKP
ncbi:MAG: hypothetical protein ACOX4O_12790 [Eubacteriales bacterium]|jgi:ubiquinone/menaquinone biosynthesis C-methylase UbiE